MRNNIQYRQAEGLWYPYRGKMKTAILQQDVQLLIEEAYSYEKYMSPVTDDLDRFKAACSAIISFARAIIGDMARVGGSKSFIRHGQRKFEDAL